MKLTYHRSGDYLLPNLAVPDAPISLGKYGRMHAAYLKEHKPILYNNLLLSGKLTNILLKWIRPVRNILKRSCHK